MKLKTPEYQPYSSKTAPIERAYLLLVRWGGPVVLSLFLLLMRLIWGLQFFQAGKGKLGNIQRPIGFFHELGIPFPTANAWLVAIVETFGGLLLLAGLGSRAVGVALSINMIVAYLTAHRKAADALFSEGDVSAFIAGGPFWFLATSLLVLALGPGMFSVDGILKRFLFKRNGLGSGTLPLR
jgi:putative oxidoreductase